MDYRFHNLTFDKMNHIRFKNKGLMVAEAATAFQLEG